MREWLDARFRAPPAQLRRKMESMLGPDITRDAADAPEVMLRAGERLLAEVASVKPQSRAQALDLLAADALVTYAFEAASELDAPMSDMAARAMAGLSAKLPAP